ncbi:MAG: hypothetical protein K2M34_01380 [Alphaproteobacteria bacterium]|nr:hypothetical protein [Alphaproteobacteria bacterium]
MTNKLRDFLDESNRRNIATAYGTDFHNRLQNIQLDNQSDELVQRILANSDLARLFDTLSKSEVPIAGYINNKFVSRRIDRLRIDMINKTIEILDYKTDINHDARRAHYIAQLGEYKNLMSQIYPDFKITCFILWTHDWILERI